MKLLEHKNLLVERNPNHRVPSQVPWYEEPVLQALHNMGEGEEGVMVTEYAPPQVIAVEWDPEEAWSRLSGKYSNGGLNKEGHAALHSVFRRGYKDFVKYVGELEDAPVKRSKKEAQPAQAAA